MEFTVTEKVENRAGLRRVLEQSLLRPEPEVEVGPELYKSDEERERSSVKPKTYVVESNTDLTNIVRNGYELQPSNDSKLWNLVVLDGSTPFYMYLDILDKRYWIIHSTYYAGKSDEIINNFILENSNHLDHLWLSSDALEGLSKKGQGTGFGISYLNAFSTLEDERPRLSVRLWGGEISDVLQGLRQIPQIHNEISLSSIGIRYQTDAGYAKEDIYYDGKFTAKSGDSIDSHLNLIETIKEYYAKVIDEIEQNYVMSYRYSEHYCTLQGTYSVILFGTRIENLQSFVEILTSGNEPFRIWGMWRSFSHNHFKVNGIDLHTNTPLELELMPDEMRIVLREGSCGNVVTRLLTNIQRNFDSGCELKGLNDANIIRSYQTH